METFLGQEECERSKLLNGASAAERRTGFPNKGVSLAVFLLGLLWAFIESHKFKDSRNQFYGIYPLVPHVIYTINFTKQI